MNKYTTPIKIISVNIPIDDIIICEDNGKERIMIERKSLSDLVSSICDCFKISIIFLLLYKYLLIVI